MEGKEIASSKEAGKVCYNKRESHFNIVTFLTALLICCGIYGFASYIHVCKIEEGQNKIIRVYAEQLKSLSLTNDDVSLRKKMKDKSMEEFHQEIKTLLELEFNRIQNEYEAVEIWTGILTVIFLIFSFYSLFKTEQLENQSKEEMAKITALNANGKTMLAQFDKDGKIKLDGIDGKIKKIKKDLTETIVKINQAKNTKALSDFDKKVEAARESLVIDFKRELENYKSKLDEEYNRKVNGINDIIMSFRENPKGFSLVNGEDGDSIGEEELDKELKLYGELKSGEE